MMRDSLAAVLLLAGSVVLFWCALSWQLDRAVQRMEARRAEDARRERRERCRRGDHRTTIDATHATITERCVDCGMTELYGRAFLTGSNRRTRRAS